MKTAARPRGPIHMRCPADWVRLAEIATDQQKIGAALDELEVRVAINGQRLRDIDRQLSALEKRIEARRCRS